MDEHRPVCLDLLGTDRQRLNIEAEALVCSAPLDIRDDDARNFNVLTGDGRDASEGGRSVVSAGETGREGQRYENRQDERHPLAPPSQGTAGHGNDRERREFDTTAVEAGCGGDTCDEGEANRQQR